jgi:hypothetical protein
MFNRKEGLAVIGVLNTQIDAVPATIEAVQSWSDLFESAEADYAALSGAMIQIVRPIALQISKAQVFSLTSGKSRSV